MGAIHGSAGLLPWALPVHPAVAVLGSAVVLAAAARVWWLHLGGPAAVSSLHWGAEDVWHFRRRDGGSERGRLLPQAYVHPRLAVLCYAVEGEEAARRRYRLGGWVGAGRVLVLTPDSCVDPDGLRRLRLRLRLMYSD